MQKRRLGKTGWDVSEIGLGCWQLGNSFGDVSDDAAQAILGEARMLGVNFWDTADVYGGGQSEQRVAVALKQAPGTRVATKVGRGDDMFQNGYVKARVKEKIQASAKRLGVDTIDLIQTHTIPPKVMEDGEIYTWLEDFQQEGLIRHFGASVETVEEGLICLRQPKLASLQIIFSLFRQDAEEKLLPEAAAEGCRHHRAPAAGERAALGKVQAGAQVRRERPPHVQRQRRDNSMSARPSPACPSRRASRSRSGWRR